MGVVFSSSVLGEDNLMSLWAPIHQVTEINSRLETGKVTMEKTQQICHFMLECWVGLAFMLTWVLSTSISHRRNPYSFCWVNRERLIITLKISTWHLTHLVLIWIFRTSSITWLLMPSMLESPCHQQQWCWICRINGSLSSTKRDFKYLCHLNVVKCKHGTTFFHQTWLSGTTAASQTKAMLENPCWPTWILTFFFSP